MKEINLLQRKKDDLAKSQKIIQILRTTSIIILFLTSLSSVALFILNSQSPIPSLKEEEKKILKQFSTVDGKIAKILIVQDRIGTVNTIINSRKKENQDNYHLIELIMQKVPQGVNINSLSFDKEQINLSVSTSSLNSVDTFLENLTKLVNGKRDFKKAVLKGLSFNGNANKYGFSLEIIL